MLNGLVSEVADSVKVEEHSMRVFIRVDGEVPLSLKARSEELTQCIKPHFAFPPESHPRFANVECPGDCDLDGIEATHGSEGGGDSEGGAAEGSEDNAASDSENDAVPSAEGGGDSVNDAVPESKDEATETPAETRADSELGGQTDSALDSGEGSASRGAVESGGPAEPTTPNASAGSGAPNGLDESPERGRNESKDGTAPGQDAPGEGEEASAKGKAK